MLLLALGFVGYRVYEFWRQEPEEPARSARGPEGDAAKSAPERPKPQKRVELRTIVTKNLFQPDRGAVGETEAADTSAGAQRLRSMVLQGTAIIGDQRYAILEVPADSRLTALRTKSAEPLKLLRLRLGDTVEGFRLSEIQDRKVVFAQGESRVEILLDYSRRAGEAVEKSPLRRAPPPAGGLRPPTKAEPAGGPKEP